MVCTEVLGHGAPRAFGPWGGRLPRQQNVPEQGAEELLQPSARPDEQGSG